MCPLAALVPLRIKKALHLRFYDMVKKRKKERKTRKNTNTHVNDKRKMANLEHPKRCSLSTRDKRATRVTSLLPRNLCERLHKSNANSFSSVSAEALRPEQRRSRCLQRSNGCRRGATEQEVRTTNVPVRWSPTLVFIICEGRQTKPRKKQKNKRKLRPFAFQIHFSCVKLIPFVFLPLQAVSWFFLLFLFPASSSRRDNEEEMRRMKDVSTSSL